MKNKIIAKWYKEKPDKTGNSKCVIIPKKYIDLLGLTNGIDVIVTKNEVIIKKSEAV